MSAPRRRSRLFTTSAFGALALAALWAAPAHAQLVQGATPAQSNGGVPTVDQSVANTTTVTLGGSRTVIDWDKFDINSGDTANFVFANRSDIVLNRVGGAGSTINGNLNGTIGSTGGATGGNIWIYNANGVVIGANARVSTGGLLITTAALDRATDSSAGGFLDGSSPSFNFSGAAAGTGIDIQAGAQINAHGGAVALIAPMISTAAGSSVSASDGGNVLYGSASSYKVSFRPTSTDDFDLISFEVANGADGAGTSNGSEVINLGGGTSGNRVFVASVSKSGLAASIVNTGTITATSVGTDETGAIVLSANHNIVNGAVEANAVAGSDFGAISVQGALTAPSVNVTASDIVSLTSDVNAAGGTVAFRSDTGLVRQTLGVITADLLTARGGAGLNFNSFHLNQVAKLGDMTADTGDITYLGGTTLELTGAINAPGKVTLGTQDFISSASTGTISAGSLAFYLGNGGSFNILGDANVGEVLSNGGLTIQAAGNINLTDTVNMALGSPLLLTAATGSILQTGGTIEGGGNLVANAASAIDLSGDNNFTFAVAQSSSGGAISLKTLGNLNLAASTSSDLTVEAGGSVHAVTLLNVGSISVHAGSGIALNLPAQSVGQYRDLVTAGGDVSVSSNATVNLAGTISAPGTVSIQSSAGAVRQLAGTISGNDIYLSAAGAIDQDAGASLSAGNSLEGHAGADLLLRGANNLGYQTPYLTAGNNADVTIRSIGDFTYNSYATHVGTLTLISDAGSINQSNAIYADTLIAQAATGLRLDGGGVGNQINTLGGLTTTAGDIAFSENTGNGFDIAGDISAPGLVQLGSLGEITTSAGHLSAGTLEVAAAGGASIDATGNLKLGAVNTFGGGAFYLGTDGDIDVIGAVDTGGRNLTLYTSDGAITTHGGTIATGGGAAVATATAKGGITLVGAGFANFWATSTDGGDIHLSGGSDIGFSVNTTGDVTIDSGGAVGNSGDVIAHSLGINAGGGISVYGSGATVDVGSYRYLTTTNGQLDIQTPGDIRLDGDVTVDGSSNADWIHLQSTSGSILQNSGKIAGGYSISLEAAQSITQDVGASILSNGPGGLYLNATDVILPGANQIDAISSYTVSHDFTLRNQGDIALWGNNVTSTGDWTLTSDTGSISGVILAHKLTATATNGFIRFNDGNSEIAVLGALTAKSTGGDNDVYIYSNTLLQLTGNITAGGVKLYTTGGINQTGGAITAARLWTGTSGSLLLGGANDFGTLTEAFHTNGGTVTIRNRGDIVLPGAQNSFGTLTLTSDQGKISQTDAITVATLVAQAATGIDLSNTANNFTTLNGLSTTAGDIRIGDSGGFMIEADIRALAGTVALTGGGTGVIDTGVTATIPHGKIDADMLTVSGFRANLYAKDDIKLGNVSTTNGFTLIADHDIDLVGTINAGASLLANTGSVTQSGGSWNTTFSAAVLAAGDITLLQGNHLTSFNGTSSGGGTIRLNNAGSGAIDVGLSTTGSAALTVGGNLSSSGITADSLSVSAGHIDLTNNVNVNTFTGLAAAYGDVFVTVGHGFTIAGDVSASTAGARSVNLYANGGGISQTSGTISAHDVTLRGTGAIAQSGTGRVVANVTSLIGGSLDLQGANHFGTGTPTTVNAGGTVKLAGDALYLQFLASAGDVTLTATAGNIQLNSSALDATSLTATASGAIQMSNGTNSVATIHGLSGSNISYTGDTFTIDGDVTADAASGIVSLTASNGNLSQTAGTISGNTVNLTADAGSVLQSGTGRVVADALAVIAHAGNIALSGANDFNGGASGFYWDAGRDVAIRNLGGIAFTGGNVGALSLVSDNGAITQTGAITAASVSASGATGVTLNTSGNAIDAVGTLNGGSGNATLKTANALTLTGTITGASVTLTGAGTIVQNAGDIIANNFTANGTALAFNATNHVNQIDVLNASAGSVSFVNRGDLILGGHVSATQDVSLTSQIGAIGGAGYVSADALTLSSARNITLDNAANAFNTLTLYAMAGDVSLTNHNGFQIGAAGVNADIHSVTFDVGGGALTAFDGTSYLTAGRFNLRSTGGGFHVVHISSDLTLGDIAVGTATLNIDGVADISLGGDILANTLNLTGTSVVQTAGTLTASRLNIYSGGNITLDGANAVAHLGNITALGTGDIVFRNAGDVDVEGNLTATGNAITLRSNTGAVGQNGGTISAASLLVSAATGIDLTAGVASLAGLSSTSGGISFSSGGPLTLDGDIDSGAANTALSAGGTITQNSGKITAGILDVTANGDLALTQQNEVESTGTINTAGGFFHFTNAGGFSIIGAIDVGSSEVTLNASGNGAISQTGAGGVVTAGTLTANGGGDVIFNRANAVGLYNAWAGVGRTVTLRNAGNLLVKAITAQNGTVNLTSDNGSVSQQVVPGFALWTGTLNVDADTEINLAQYNFVDTLGTLNAGGSIQFNNAGTVMLGGNIQTNATLAMQVGGYIGQTGGTITADHLDLTAAGIALLSANDIGSTNSSNLVATDDITFHSANAILLGNVSTSGLLSLTADSGDIRQLAAFAADRLDASALAGDIVLDLNNAVGTLNDITAAGGFTLKTSTDLTLDGRISAPDLVKLTADGDITQIGNQAIYTDELQATSGATAAHGISLLNHNQVGLAALNSNGKDLRFRNTGNFQLGNISAAGHIVEMISDTGSVTQLAGTSILAGTFSATGTNVVLDNTGNQISRIGLISTGADLSLRNDVALQIDRIDAGSHNVTISNTGDLTGGNITADRLTVSAAGGMVGLNSANHVNSIGAFSGTQFEFVNDGSFTIAGAINNAMYQTFLTSQTGSISMAAGGAVNSGGLTVQAATGIALTGNMSNIYGATTSSGDVSLISGLLDIQGDIRGDTVTLGGNANGGFVRQTSGSITANRLNASGNGGVQLDGATNHIATLGTLSSGDDVVINSLDAVTLTGNIDAGDVFALTSGGAVSQTGGRINSFSLNVSADAGTGAITLGQTNQVSSSGTVVLTGTDIRFRNDGTFILGNVNADGALTLTSVNGSIGQENGTSITADSLTATAGDVLGFNQINQIGTVGKLAAGTGYVVFVSGISYDLTDDISSGAGSFVSLSGAAAINQTGGTITTDSLNIDANRAYLERANNVTQLNSVSVSGDFIFRNTGDIALWGTVNAGYLGLHSDTGGVTNPGGLFHVDTLDVRAAGSVYLNGGSFNYLDNLTSQNGDITIITGSHIQGGNLIAAANGTVDLTVGGIVTDAVRTNLLKIDATGGDIELLGDNAVAHLGNIFGDNISLAVGTSDITGWLHGNNSVAFTRSGIASDFALAMGAGGAITTDMISLSNTGSAGTATLSNITTGSGTLELNLNFSGNASVTANTSAISLNNATVAGDLTLFAGHAITNTGAATSITGTLNASNFADDITLLFGSDSVGHFGTFSAGGNIQLGANAVDITGNIQALGGSASFFASFGNVSQFGNMGIDAATVSGGAHGGFMLAGGGNNFTHVGAISALGDITLYSSNSFEIGGSLLSGGWMTLFSGGSDITVDSSGGYTLRAAILTADATDVVDLGGATSQFDILGNIEARSFTLVNQGDLDLQGGVLADTANIQTTGRISQSYGRVTIGTLDISAGTGITLGAQNRVDTLRASTATGAISFTNERSLVIDGALANSGDITLNVAGDLTAAGGLSSGGLLSITANGIQAGGLSGDGGVLVSGGSHALNLGAITSGDDVSVTGSGNVSVAALDMTGANDAAGDGFNALLSGGNVTLGTASGPITGASYVNFDGAATPGSVSIQATGDATVRIDDTNFAIGIAATGAVDAESNNQLLLADASGANVTLRAGTSLSAGAIATTGAFSVTAADIGAFSIDRTNGDPLDIVINDTAGDLTLTGTIAARRNVTVTSVGDIHGGAAQLGAGVTMDGTLSVSGGDITLAEASGNYDVVLNGTGTVDTGLTYVGRSYTLTGSSFAGSALTPIGPRTGSWSLTSLAGLDLGGATLDYYGDIDFHVTGLLENGTIKSLSGAVTGTAAAIDIYEMLAATGLDVSATTGTLQLFHASTTDGDLTLRGQQGLTVSGSVEAGAAVNLTAQFGSTTAGYATAGSDISVFSLFGNATLRQATLTGATGDLSVQSIAGTATLGAGTAAGIGTDNYFERAAGSAGTVSITGAGGALVNLDHSAALGVVQANHVEINVSDGDLNLQFLNAFSGNASVYLGHGSLTVGSAVGGTLDLEAWGGNLTLSGGTITANDLILLSSGTIDTTAVSSLSAGHYIDIEGGTIRAAALSSGGNAEIYGGTGGVTIDAVSATGDLTVGSLSNLSINQASATGYADLGASGTATIRGLTAATGFEILAQGTITLGADAGDVVGTGNTVSTNGTLGGCGCDGGWIASAGGNISINLLSVTGVLGSVKADNGDVSIALQSGDLGINQLRGYNIGITLPGVLTMFDVGNSGGRYALTAADFAGDALNPTLAGGAGSFGDVTIIDTVGDLGGSGTFISSGDIHVEAQGGAITGLLSLDAQGDVTAIGRGGVRLNGAFGHNVTLDAGTGTIDVVGSLGVDNNYTLIGGDFAGETLAPWSSRAGALTITDTVGDFNFGSTDITFAGPVSITAADGALNIGYVQAGDAITLVAGGDLSLTGAGYYYTGANTLSLAAGGDLRFGAADASSITASNVFSNIGTALTGTTIHAGSGNVAINLYQADALGSIEGGTVQIAVRTGDFSAGNIDTAGALTVQGPSGRLTLGNLTTNGGDITVNGQGNTTLGDVFGHLAIELNTGAGNLTFGNVTGGDVSLAAGGRINGASVSAATLGVIAMGGTANLDNGGTGSHVASLGDVTIGNGDFILRNLRDLDLNGAIEVSGLLDLQVTGALTQSGHYILADRLQGNATGMATLTGDNRINALGDFSANGLTLNTTTALVIDGVIQGNNGAVKIASHGGMEIDGAITSSASGDAITLASDGLFTNLAGAGALGTPNGRWLVYTQTGGNAGHSDPNNNFGGLAGTSYYGDAFNFGTLDFASAPNAGNRFVYGYRPVLTVTPSSVHMVYDGTAPTVSATVTGFINGDSAAGAWSGAPDISGVGSNAGTYFAYSSIGTLTSEMGYTFAFVPGTVIIDPRVISVVLNANDRTYDGTTAATGALTLNGVIAGDTVSANAANLAFDDRNAGTRTVTASGITLSGASAGNYIVSATATDLADIMARAITATLTANGRTYDGTTDATGTLALSGVLGNDQVNVSGSAFAFDSKNAGTRTVTASGITLSGNDAGNYTVNVSATDLADILARAITATLTANDRTYDGTTAATGTLSLSGVLGNDQVGANGSAFAFDNKNAGTGRTVTASGITLSGADAGNYSVNASATDLADILARAITATLNANDRSYDGTLAATGTLSLNGVVAGDSVAAGAGSLLFDNKNAGTGRTVTASGITLSGGDAGNYTVNTTATDLADILARAITATLAANGRVYDGTSIATGTLSLNGVLSGDQVSVSAGSIAFDSKNAGSRTATASGLVLGGTDAANYAISGTATGTATIAQRAITATATADSHVYDGTTATTGRIALSGVISGDTVTGTASYRFADANAGTGRAVQVSGLGLTGADAANYTVTLSATPVTADITRRAVTVTVQDATKILGQPDPVFGYSVSSGSVVNGDAFTGALARDAGDQAGRYAIGQGTLALSANYLLTVVPGTLVISFTQSGAEASDALKMLQAGVGTRFSVNQDPSRNLEGDGGQGAGGDGDK